jgi:hypothetical protein
MRLPRCPHFFLPMRPPAGERKERLYQHVVAQRRAGAVASLPSSRELCEQVFG